MVVNSTDERREHGVSSTPASTNKPLESPTAFQYRVSKARNKGMLILAISSGLFMGATGFDSLLIGGLDNSLSYDVIVQKL